MVVKTFQFHKGTIKTVAPVVSVAPTENFNSIKVRLKQTDKDMAGNNDLYFNSIKVRLKPIRTKI